MDDLSFIRFLFYTITFFLSFTFLNYSRNFMKKHILPILIVVGLSSCSSDSIKEKINKAGDVAGQTAGEFIEGASKGVKKVFDVKLKLSDALVAQGIALGKCSVSSDSLGSDNMLLAYIIFNKDFKGTLTAKVFDENGLEMGRSKSSVSSTTGNAGFVEFHFDKNTHIGSKNVLELD